VRGTDRCVRISLHSGTNHAHRRSFESNKLDGTIPAALSALKLLSVLCARRARDAAPRACVRAPALWCLQAPLRARALTVALPCACPRRTWPRVRWQQPPEVAHRRGVLGIVGSTPSRARAPCVPVASAAHVPFHYHSTHGPMSTPRVPSKYPASSGEVGPLLRLPFEYRIRGAAGLRVLAALPSTHDGRTPVSPLRVLSDPAARRLCTLSAPPCRACRGTCVLAQWRAFSTPSSTRVQYPLGRRPMWPHRVMCCCECAARTGAYAFHCTAGRTMHVAGFLARTRSTARSRTRCRRSSNLSNCAPSPRAMPRRAPACERLPVGVFRHPCMRPHAPSHRRARALAARGREYAGSGPRQWPSAVGYSVSLAVPYRVLVPHASPLRVPRTSRSTAPPRIIPRMGP
jgi:hypothetical protein